MAIATALAHVAAQSGESTAWWAPGQGTPLAEFATYDNDRGQVGILDVSGRLETAGHPFFELIGTNGRACISCHQPADGMALSLRSIRERWEATRGADPLFAAVDGMNCPTLPRGDARSHSPLLERGLIRIALPWPPIRPDGTPVDPDTTHQNFGVGPFVGKNGMPTATDPLTGRPTSMNLLADARPPTLAAQAADAAMNHLQVAGTLSPEQIARIVEFESQVYSCGGMTGLPKPPA